MLVDWIAGTPVRVPVAGMILAGVSQSGESNWPNTIRPTAPGNTSSAGTGRKDDVVEPLLKVCRRHWIAATFALGKSARMRAGAGVRALSRSRIFSSTAVALWVVNTLAVTTLSGSMPEASIASRTALR